LRIDQALADHVRVENCDGEVPDATGNVTLTTCDERQPMDVISDKHEGDIMVDEGRDVDVQGTVAGSCEVRGGSLAVHGTVTGNVTVLAGWLTVAGTVAGDLVVHGGSVEVSGTIVGRLVDHGDGEITVHPGALVDGTEAPTIGA
jgi:cytoskeletal protein CcmA (bactofilin family)